MSRTDKTRPLRVKAMDTPTGIEAQHDHRTGPCDLPARPTAPLECLWGDRATRCYWAASMEFLRSPAGQCGCTAHSKKYDDYYTKEKARQRTARRMARQEALLDVSEHGIHDDLSDVFDWTRLAEDPDFDNASDFHWEVAQFADLAERLDLPKGALVVGTGNLPGHRCCSNRGGLYGLHDHPHTHAEVLHPDGRRERIPVNRNDETVPGGFDEPDHSDLLPPERDDFWGDYDANPADYLADIDADLYSERMHGPSDPAWYREATGRGLAPKGLPDATTTGAATS